MKLKKSKRTCGWCDHFEPFGTWRTNYFGAYCEGTCANTGRVIPYAHHACKDFILRLDNGKIH